MALKRLHILSTGTVDKFAGALCWEITDETLSELITSFTCPVPIISRGDERALGWVLSLEVRGSELWARADISEPVCALIAAISLAQASPCIKMIPGAATLVNVMFCNDALPIAGRLSTMEDAA